MRFERSSLRAQFAVWTSAIDGWIGMYPTGRDTSVMSPGGGTKRLPLHAIAQRDARLRGAEASVEAAVTRRCEAAGLQVARAISRYAMVSERATIAEGAAVLPGGVVNAGTKIGRGAVVNTNASVDHDCVIGDHVHVAPGVAIAGGVRIGAGTLVGLGARVLPNLRIGARAVVGPNRRRT